MEHEASQGLSWPSDAALAGDEGKERVMLFLKEDGM
jgi:hypothetical protein